MSNKVTAMLAFIFLIVLIIIVVVGLSFNPAPAEIVRQCQEKSATDLLLEKTKCRSLSPDSRSSESSMTPSVRNQLSPISVASSTNSPWEALEKMRADKKERDSC
jgi:hypothetical protein